MKTYGFAKTDRLLKRSEYMRLSKKRQPGSTRTENSRTVFDPYFIVAFLPGLCDRNRFGITVTRRIGNAVVRNRIKRAAREAFRHNNHLIGGNWDINVIAKKPSVEISSGRLQDSLKELFLKIKGKL